MLILLLMLTLGSGQAAEPPKKKTYRGSSTCVARSFDPALEKMAKSHLSTLGKVAIQPMNFDKAADPKKAHE